ncbi:hypothetical protein N8Z24_00810 [bacterium]|nr:hypothetical protein [bacterium]
MKCPKCEKGRVSYQVPVNCFNLDGAFTHIAKETKYKACSHCHGKGKLKKGDWWMCENRYYEYYYKVLQYNAYDPPFPNGWDPIFRMEKVD